MVRTKAFLSCGNYFRVTSSRKNSIVLTTNTPPTWPPCRVVASQEWPTLNSIRQTGVDTLMIRTQRRVRVWVRVWVRVTYLNQTEIRHQILGGVGVRVMHSKSDAPSSNRTHSIQTFFFLKN